MQHMALLALEDHEVDLLSRVRQRDDVRLGAVYHPDPAALVVRLAGLAHVPVVFDIEALAALPIDFCVCGEKAAPAARELIGRASREGKPAPVFVPAEDFDLYLKDPSAYTAQHGGAAAPEAAETPIEGAPEPVAAEPEGAPDIVDTGEPTAEIPAHANPPPPEPVATAPPGDVDRPDTAPVTKLSPDPANRDTASAPGSPSLRDLYDPLRLSRWIVDAALETGKGFAAVLWRREAEGQRFSLQSFAPDADQLPTIPFPPLELETHVKAGTARIVDPPRAAGSDGSSPLKLLVVPLGGERGPFGLLGVFRRTSEGTFTESARAALAQRADDFGVALERSVAFAGMGAELRSLRFKERVRDLMLDPHIPASERWSRLLDFLVMETQADFAQFLRVSDDRSRLSLEAAAGLSGDFEGWVSIPVGRGMVGRAFNQPGVTVYTADDIGDDRGVYLLPVRSGGDPEGAPIGVIVLDGAADTNSAGEDTSALLHNVADIVAPLLKTPVVGGRA